MRQPPYFEGMAREPGRVEDVLEARCLVSLGDSVTTDHISPAGSIRPDGPAGLYLVGHGVERAGFNSYGSRRGNHEVMVRGTFANVRLRNLLVPESEGTWTAHLPSGDETTIFEAAQRYIAEGVPTIVLAGKEYGSGSSRDWAAKGPKLLGVKAVIAESYERIHRSNLLMMGILPLQFLEGASRESLGLTGREVFSVTGVEDGEAREVTVRADEKEFRRDPAARHAARAGVRPPRRDPPVRAAEAGSRVVATDEADATSGASGDELRSLLGRFPAGVAVVTVDAGGQRLGLTVGSLVGLSLDPPLVGFSISRQAALHELLREAGGCAISLLAAGQDWLAEHFARGVPPIGMWHGVATEPGARGAPLLVGALGWLECAVRDEVAVGTHTLFVCAVERVEHGVDAPALVRVRGLFAST